MKLNAQIYAMFHFEDHVIIFSSTGACNNHFRPNEPSNCSAERFVNALSAAINSNNNRGNNRASCTNKTIVGAECSIRQLILWDFRMARGRRKNVYIYTYTSISLWISSTVAADCQFNTQLMINKCQALCGGFKSAVHADSCTATTGLIRPMITDQWHSLSSNHLSELLFPGSEVLIPATKYFTLALAN